MERVREETYYCYRINDVSQITFNALRCFLTIELYRITKLPEVSSSFVIPGSISNSLKNYVC